MPSFHSDQKVKEELISGLREHYSFRDKESPYRCGCTKGCPLLDRATEGGFYSYFEDNYGIPHWLTHFEEDIFEELPYEAKPEFEIELFNAIPVGVDLDNVKWRFAILMYKRTLPRLKDIDDQRAYKCKKAVEMAIDYCELMLSGEVDESAAKSVANSVEEYAWDAYKSIIRPDANGRFVKSERSGDIYCHQAAARSAFSLAINEWGLTSASDASISVAILGTEYSVERDMRLSELTWQADSLIKLLKELKND